MRTDYTHATQAVATITSVDGTRQCFIYVCNPRTGGLGVQACNAATGAPEGLPHIGFRTVAEATAHAYRMLPPTAVVGARHVEMLARA